jgi:uncharacterized protein
MEKLPFTNVHAHVFNTECVPDNFLRILPMNLVRRMPKTVKLMLDSKYARAFIKTTSKLTSRKDTNKRNNFDKYIAFLDIAEQRKQLDVFELAYKAGRQYDSRLRVIGLTMNMDYMDNRTSKRQICYAAQLDGVKDIKRYYPDNFFPFLGVDPRHRSNSDLVKWSKAYFETGLEKDGKVYPYFSGIKLYPALGFFPFDPKLAELYAYAQANELPVMTHVTRVGSQYIGSRITELIPRMPEMLLPSPVSQAAAVARDNIHTRIERYYLAGWISDNKRGDNDYACDLFSHPENYIPVLEAFPKLKICLAHMGGTTEIATLPGSDPENMLKKIRVLDPIFWFDRIRDIMVHYPNVYTDVSYTLSDLDHSEVRDKIKAFMDTTDKQGQPLYKRVLFGTDFFMSEQEKCESDLYKLAGQELAAYFDAITRDNPHEFLKQPL